MRVVKYQRGFYKYSSSTIFLMISVISLIFSYHLESFSLLLTALLFALMILFIWVKPFQNSILVIFFSVLSFLTLEILITVLDSNTPYFDNKTSYVNPGTFQPDEALGYSMKPGSFYSRKYKANGDILYQTSYNIGSNGYRLDSSFTPLELETRIHKVNLYGGSFTFGEGLRDDETISSYLNEITSSYGFYNFGVPGYGPNHALAQLLSEEHSKQADFNVLLTFPNHVRRTSCMLQHTVGSPRFIIDEEILLKRDGQCFSDSNSFNFLFRVAFKSKLISALYTIFFVKTEDADILLYKEILKQFVSISRDKGQHPVIALLPNSKSSRDNESYEVYKDPALKRFVVDTTLYDSDGKLSERFYIDEEDTHPTNKANKNRAFILYNYLQELTIVN